MSKTQFILTAQAIVFLITSSSIYNYRTLLLFIIIITIALFITFLTPTHRDVREGSV